MKKEIFLRQFPQELEYEASKLYNAFEIAKKYEIINQQLSDEILQKILLST